MTSPTSNLLPFPFRRVHTALVSPPPVFDPASTITTANLDADTLAAEEHREYVATIVNAAIRFGRRNGRSFSNLPSQLRKWLTNLCDAGDPACLVVRDWLNGNRHYLEPLPDSSDADPFTRNDCVREGL